MSKRLLVIAVLLFMPLAASADSSAPDAASSLLGPQASGTAGTGSSSAAISSLQPAGQSLQSSPASSSGLTAPTSSQLDAPASSNATLNVIAGEADGPTYGPSSTAISWDWLWLCLLVGFLVAGGSLLWRQYSVGAIFMRAMGRRPALQPVELFEETAEEDPEADPNLESDDEQPKRDPEDDDSASSESAARAKAVDGPDDGPSPEDAVAPTDIDADSRTMPPPEQLTETTAVVPAPIRSKKRSKRHAKH